MDEDGAKAWWIKKHGDNPEVKKVKNLDRALRNILQMAGQGSTGDLNFEIGKNAIQRRIAGIEAKAARESLAQRADKDELVRTLTETQDQLILREREKGRIARELVIYQLRAGVPANEEVAEEPDAPPPTPSEDQ